MLTPELLAELRENANAAKSDAEWFVDAGWRGGVTCTKREGRFIAEASPPVVLALLDRIAELERVAKAVEGITADAAENGNCADCPYVGMEEAAALLAIIRKGR